MERGADKGDGGVEREFPLSQHHHLTTPLLHQRAKDLLGRPAVPATPQGGGEVVQDHTQLPYSHAHSHAHLLPCTPLPETLGVELEYLRGLPWGEGGHVPTQSLLIAGGQPGC